MKHIKIFEDYYEFEDESEDDDLEDDFEYYTTQKNGDYIKLEENDNDWNIIGLFAKIIEVENTKYDRNGDEKFQPSYKVQGINKDTNKLETFWINEDEIDCELKPHEIKKFDLLLMSNKFNI